jgi:hypothetical protein
VIPRPLIDRLFEEISNHDLIDKWNYPVRAATELINYIKSGYSLQPDTPFLKPSRFSSYNNISLERLHGILLPVFQEFQSLLLLALLSDIDSFMIQVKAQIQTVHAKAINNNGHPLEDIGRQIISGMLFGYFRREGYVYHEVPSGRGFIDIIVCADQEIIIEAKLHSNFNPKSRQLQSYIRAGTNRKGYFVIFDNTKSFKYQIYCDIENRTYPPISRYAVLVCHTNPARPSSI